MRLKSVSFAVTLFFAVMFLTTPLRGRAQQPASTSTASAASSTASLLPDAPQPRTSSQQGFSGEPGTAATPKPQPPPQPKRILGLMPNYRAVSAGVRPPPPGPRRAFVIASQNSFDYSSGAFVGITSLMAEGSNAHPQLGKGVKGFWGYYWRGFVDKADGNYWVIWIMPTITHEDERYYSKGVGSILDRVAYSTSRVLITPNYHGKNTFNVSEVFGRGISQAISLTYYPSADQNIGPFMEKYGYAIGRDAVTNAFREFWPDIDAHFIHRHHHQQ